jgi:2-hydroxyglutarate dehydrogenase
MQVDHLVVGAGVVGLAIASHLCKRYPDKSTFLVERHVRAGEETSSRNSEVIHGGLYYPAESLKTMLCLKGREMMYRRCEEWGVPFKQTGKLVVGPKESKEYLEGMQRHISTLGPLAPPVRLLSGAEAKELEPDISSEIGWALLSERTGIVSSHELMDSLEREILDSDSAELVYDTEVVRIDPHLPDRSGTAASGKRGSDDSSEGWVVQTNTGDQAEPDAILARVVINSSGLNGQLALNALHADKRFAEGTERMGMWYSKGNYTSYKGPGVKNVKRLLYPVPSMTKGAHSHESLGSEYVATGREGSCANRLACSLLVYFDCSSPHPRPGWQHQVWTGFRVAQTSFLLLERRLLEVSSSSQLIR